ncbi:SLAP domain-containing protein [Lactobacillus sp. LL6]|uniref:SLAP domain-containing protein n=1 Tax=Lactobacillus sp. LL6 TaxID=2596827 RepID=UPI001186CB84|nr:SLAP domain-containing protein [Lactobacillus sp. LL6]TSO26734.1 hypothetical protein FOD82_06635 [Lactobacillus sp. LL6]
MKLNKKIIIGATALTLGSLSVVAINTNNSNYVSASTTSTKETTVKLRLNHNSYVYDKNGKRLKKYKGKKALIKKSQKLTVKGKIEPIQKAKRYYFYDNDVNNNIIPYWLAYTKIKGNYYYSIGNKGYIKCINVKSINGDDNRLISTEATVIIKPRIGKVAHTWNKLGKQTTKTYKSGQKLIIDDTNILPNQNTYSYRVKGTDYWVSAQDLKSYPRPSHTVTSHLQFH